MRFVVRGKLDQVVKQIQKKLNTGRTEKEDVEFIRTIRMSTHFVRHLDYFVRIILKKVFDMYMELPGQENELNDDSLDTTIEDFISRYELQDVDVAEQEDGKPVLRIVLVRIHEYLTDEYTKLKVSTCKILRNAQLRKVAEKALVPVLHKCLQKCIEESQEENVKKTKRKEKEGKRQDQEDKEENILNETVNKKERKTKRYHCVRLERPVLFKVAEDIISGMQDDFGMCIERCKTTHAKPLESKTNDIEDAEEQAHEEKIEDHDRTGSQDTPSTQEMELDLSD
jgi:hypothetical protein